MNNTTINRVDSSNLYMLIPGIVHVFRDDEVVPWHKYDECLAWVTKRVERGFYITVACDSDIITGYSEWIETYDKGEKILYLGIMQVDCELRSRGIGKLMLDDGEAYAKSIGASRLRTMPEDERSYNFYRKYGYAETDIIYSCTCPTMASDEPYNIPAITTITVEIANTHDFIFGLWQSSSRHMYEVANHNPAPEEFLVKTAAHPEGYLQFRYKQDSTKALALYWSNKEATAETVSAILASGYAEGFKEIDFAFKTKHMNLFADYNPTRDSEEIEKMIQQTQ